MTKCRKKAQRARRGTFLGRKRVSRPSGTVEDGHPAGARAYAMCIRISCGTRIVRTLFYAWLEAWAAEESL